MNTSVFSYQIGATTDEQREVIAIQKSNLRPLLSPEEANAQGFVTVSHTEPILADLCAILPPSICKSSEGLVAGYALAMDRSLQSSVPALRYMFERFEEIIYKGKRLSDISFFVMGQVCIAKPFRGLGVFDKLYQTLITHYKQQFDLVVTEISVLNTRSLAAHKRVGFEIIETYSAPNGSGWHIVALPLSDK